MPTLNDLVTSAQGVRKPSAPTSVSPGGSSLSALVKASKRAPATPPGAPSAVPSAVSPASTPVSTPTPPKSPSILSKISSAIAGAIAPPPQDNKYHSPLAFLPSELARHIPLGVGEAIKEIQDQPDIAAQVGPKELAKEIPGALLDTAKSFGKAALSYPLTFYGAGGALLNKIGLKAPGVGPSGEVNANVPLLGPTPNLQQRTAEYAANNPAPTDALGKVGEAGQIAGLVGGELLNGLFTASLANAPFAPRSSTIAKTPGAVPGITVNNPPRSFRLYEPPVGVQPLSPTQVQSLIDNGVEVKNFNPDLPTYFKLKGTGTGQAVGELVQVKPSYFDTLMSQFKGDVSKAPPTALISLGEVKPPEPGSTEALTEQAGGWQPGTKQVFDTALAHGDAATVQRLLPVVPEAYRTQFADTINKIVQSAPTAPAPAAGPGIIPPVVSPPSPSAPTIATPPVPVPPPSVVPPAVPKPSVPKPPVPKPPTPVSATKPVEATTYGINDVVKLTDKTTGKSVEKTVTGLLPDGSGLMVRDSVSGIPYKATFDRFNFDLVTKGDNNASLPKIGTTFREQKAMEEAGVKTEAEAKRFLTQYRTKPVEPAKTPEAEGIAVKPPALKPRTLTIKPAEMKKEKTQGAGNTQVGVTEIAGKRVETPTQLVTKTDLKAILKSAGKDSLDFNVIEKDGALYMSNEGPDIHGYPSKTLIRPSALGLVEANIKPGDRIRITKADLQEKGNALRAHGPGGEVSAARGGAKVDQFENRIGEPVKSQTPENFKLFNKVQDLIRKYASRVGEGYLPKGAAGVFYHNTQNIRLQGMNDLSVAAHEITHHLDFINKISQKLMKVVGYSKDGNPIYEGGTAALRKELTKMYEQNYPTGRHDHPLKKRMVEGYATLLQKYVESPKTTEQNFPNLVREMLKPGGKFYTPVIGEIVKDLQGIVTDYQSLDPLDKVGARVTSDHNNMGKDSFLTPAEIVRTEIADELYPIEKLANEAGVGMTKDDPMLWIRQYNNMGSLFGNNVLSNRGFWTYENGDFKKQLDFNWGTLQKGLEKNQAYDLFNHYLVARDQHFNFIELNKLKTDFELLKSMVDEKGMAEAQITVGPTGKTLWQEYKDAKAAYQEQKDIMDMNGFSESVVRDAYLQNRDRFTKEEGMYDALVREDLKFLNQPDIGIVSDEEYAKLTSKEGYASLKRQFYDEIAGEEKPGGRGIAGVRPGSLKARTGSQRTILAPVFSGIKNHAEVLRKGLRQIVNNKIVGVALKGQHPGLFQPQQVIRVPDPNTGRILYPQEKDPNIIMGRINGKRVPVLVDGYIKKTIGEILDFTNVGVFEKLLQGASRFFTKGTTGLYAPFAVTNYTIDQITALANTQNNYRPVFDPLKTLSKALMQKDSPEAHYFQEYLVMGGERQTFAHWQDLSAREIAQKVAHERTGLLKVVDVLDKGMDIAAIPSTYSEIATRATEYIKARQAGKDSIVALEQAGRVTAPFHHVGRLGGGKFGKALVKSIPFFNPLIQVFEQTYRQGFKSGPKNRNRLLWTMLALTAANVASFALLNSTGTKEQKNTYKDLEPSELSGYMWFPSPDGKNLIKMRMPNELNWAGTLINMTLADQLVKTKYSAGDYISAGTAFLPQQINILEPAQLLFSWIPQLVKPAILTTANIKDFPTIRPLESQTQTAKEPGQRATPSTPALDIAVGKALNISPIKLDYLLTGYFGRATGFLTGKPGILNPLSSVIRQDYFESGRRVQNYYNQKTTNDEQYNTLLHNPTALSGTQKGEILKARSKLSEVNALLGAYSATPSTDTERLSALRDQILGKLDQL